MNWESLSAPDQARVKRWQIGMLVLAIVCEIFLAADWYAFAAVISFVSQDLGLDPQQAGLAQGIFALTYGLGMVLWSPVSRNMSARTMLLIGLAGTGFGMVLQVFVQNYTQLLLLRLAIGFFDAAIFIGNMKLIFDWFPQRRRGSVIGMILAAYSLAITLDFALGIPLTIAVGWRTFFAVLAVGTLIVAVIDAVAVRAGPAGIGYAGFKWEDEPDVAHLPLRDIFKSKWVIVGGLGIAACTFAIAGTATWVVPSFIAIQNMPVESAALIGTLMGLSQVVFLIIGGYMADSMGKAFMIKLTAFLALLVAVMFVSSTIYPLPFGMLVLYAALSGLAVLGGGAIFALLSDKYHDSLAPAAVGYAEVFGLLSSFVAPWLMGAIINTSSGFTGAFVAFAVIEGLFFVVLVFLARETIAHRPAAQPAE
ncbi:MFS transporter [Microbaculum marinum]|uniref:MFS transporter n=1 Tax=Microbaculum marinum TaxID=1764581 RepID=A0AAW9RP06_9HYPH